MFKNKKYTLYIILVLMVIVIMGLLLFIDRSDYNYKIKDTLVDGAGKDATVIILGGQSNASGCSHNEYLSKNVSVDKYNEYQNGYENVYINYISGAKASNEFVFCKVGQGEIDNGFGPELGLAEKLNELYPDQTFFIIKCAWGATNLFEQWLSPSSKGKTGELYKAFEAFVEFNLKYLEYKNYNVKVEAMCWMQGESDSFSVENATNYEKHLTNFIADVRKNFKNYASNDGIAFIDATIAKNPVYWVYCDLVNQSKQNVKELSSMNVLIDTNLAGLSCSSEPADVPDLAHYDSLSEIMLGHLFALEVSKFID